MSNCNADANMLMKQQETTNQINALLQQSSQMLLCGPGSECERTKKTNELQQKYLASQTNIITAPYEEKQAEKDYYIYAKGNAEYNAMIYQRLEKEATKKTNDILLAFNKNVTTATGLNEEFGTLAQNLANVTELYQRYVKENKALSSRIRSFNTDLVTSDRMTFYEKQNYDIIKGRYSVWFWIYIALVVVFALGIFLSKSTYTFVTKIIILLLLIIYPFVIDYISTYVLKGIYNASTLVPKNVYVSNGEDE